QGDAAFLAGGEGGGVHGPEGEHADRDLVAVQAVGAEVLAGHDRRGGGDVGGAQSAGEDGGQAVAQRRVVVERGGVFVDLDLGGLVGGQAVGLGDAGGHAADRGQNALADLFLVGAHGEEQGGRVGDDVVFGAGLDRAHRHHRLIEGRGFAADDGLERHHELGGGDDRVLAGLGKRSVGAAPVQRDRDRGGAGHGVAGRHAHMSGGEAGGVVQGDDHVGLGKAGVDVVGEQGVGAVDGLLGGLAHENQRAVPLAAQPHHGAGGAEQHGHVDVVAAGVHYGDGGSVVALGGDMAGVGQSGLFGDRERVELAADPERGAGSVAQDGDEAVAGPFGVVVMAEVVGDLVAGGAQLRGHEGRGLGLLVRELGGLVQLLVGGDQIRRFGL